MAQYRGRCGTLLQCVCTGGLSVYVYGERSELFAEISVYKYTGGGSCGVLSSKQNPRKEGSVLLANWERAVGEWGGYR